MICCIVYNYATSLHYIMGETISLGSSKFLKSKGLFWLNFVQNLIIPVLTGEPIFVKNVVLIGKHLLRVFDKLEIRHTNGLLCAEE